MPLHTMNTRPLISRKEIASMTGLSADQIRKNEKRLGLDRARHDLNRRCVYYKTAIAIPILRAKFLV